MNPVPPRVGVVVLTQGKRPRELQAAVASVLEQTDVIADVAVVGNGWDPASAVPPLPDGVAGVHLPVNLGIPAGRNRGAGHVSAETLLFLDDDASLADVGFLGACLRLLGEHPDIGVVQPRVVDPQSGRTARQWIPRMRKQSPDHSGNVFSFWEGATVVRRNVLDAAGGWADPFFYAHEGIELAWRVWDAGYRVWYAGDLTVHHPVIEQSRHSQYYRLNARNRVWLARRNLPALLRPVYVGSWTVVQLVRWWNRPRMLVAWFAGWWEGWRSDPGEQRPISWRTVARMTAAGRPPIV